MEALNSFLLFDYMDILEYDVLRMELKAKSVVGSYLLDVFRIFQNFRVQKSEFLG